MDSEVRLLRLEVNRGTHILGEPPLLMTLGCVGTAKWAMGPDLSTGDNGLTHSLGTGVHNSREYSR